MITLLEYIVTLPKYNTCQRESIAPVSDCEGYEDVGCLLLQSVECIYRVMVDLMDRQH